jgi:hypothetical protein
MKIRKYPTAFYDDVKTKTQINRLMHTLEERALREPLITFLIHTLERMNIMNKRNEYEKTMHELQRKRVVALQGKH